jgi:hypothetical protein
MEPKGSLPCSKGPAVGPYPELDKSSPYYLIAFLYSPFQISPPIYAQTFVVS